ncbi:MAG TPA: glutamine amidotransferase, partial [Planctomycetota bacterium]|nr:glutamine amidotransferase [Planctomycetota bacterium]
GSMFVHSTYRTAGLPYSHRMQSWWEHQFLESALTEDLDVEVDVLAKDDDFKSRRNPGASHIDIKTVKEGYPKTKKDLYQYDVIINSDIPYSRFSPEQVQWTVDFVGKHGGGFVMIGGWDAFGEGGYAKTAFDRMLPVEMSAGDMHMDEIEFNWVVTDKGWQHPIMQVAKDPEENRRAWESLPVFRGFSRTTRHKPAAEVLAEVSNEEDFGTLYGASIVLAVQQYGNGRSMAFTTDSTGGWGAEWEDSWGVSSEGDHNRNKYYKQFWKNAVRWLAHYRMQAPNQLVQIETDRLVYGRGEQPVLRVKVMNEDYELTHDANVQVSIATPEGSTQSVTVFPKYDEPGIYERKLELNATGKYELSASAILKKEEVGTDRTILQVRPSSAEMRQLSQNVELLKKLATQTGGVYLPLEKASDLPQHLREATHVIEKHRDNDLWDRPYIFLLIIGLLCGEWFLRKRSGLP